MISTDFYLHFNGQCAAAFLFYKSIFGGEFLAFQRFKDMPGSEKMSSSDSERLMHVSLKLTDSTTLMGSDTPSNDTSQFVPGNNYHICIHAESEKEANILFQKLSEDGKLEMPMNKTFWGAYFGMTEDKFGVHWMISYTNPQFNP